MKYTPKFNEKRDIARVVPNLSISLKEAVETGEILDTGVIPEYNDIDSADKVIGMVRDNFEAVDSMKLVQSLGKKAPATPTPATPTPATAQQPVQAGA